MTGYKHIKFTVYGFLLLLVVFMAAALIPKTTLAYLFGVTLAIGASWLVGVLISTFVEDEV